MPAFAAPPPVGWPVRVASGAHAGATGTVVSGPRGDLDTAEAAPVVAVQLDGCDTVARVNWRDLGRFAP